MYLRTTLEVMGGPLSFSKLRFAAVSHCRTIEDFFSPGPWRVSVLSSPHVRTQAADGESLQEFLGRLPVSIVVKSLLPVALQRYSLLLHCLEVLRLRHSACGLQAQPPVCSRKAG